MFNNFYNIASTDKGLADQREKHWIDKGLQNITKMKGLEISGLSRGWHPNEESGRQRSRTRIEEASSKNHNNNNMEINDRRIFLSQIISQ